MGSSGSRGWLGCLLGGLHWLFFFLLKVVFGFCFASGGYLVSMDGRGAKGGGKGDQVGTSSLASRDTARHSNTSQKHIHPLVSPLLVCNRDIYNTTHTTTPLSDIPPCPPPLQQTPITNPDLTIQPTQIMTMTMPNISVFLQQQTQ